MTKYPEPQDDSITPGKLTKREKQLLKRMDQDDKHDSKMARDDAKAEARNRKKAIKDGAKIVRKNAAKARKKGK